MPYKLKHLHYRRNYKGEDNWGLVSPKEFQGKFTDEQLEALDNHIRLETDFAFYEL